MITLKKNLVFPILLLLVINCKNDDDGISQIDSFNNLMIGTWESVTPELNAQGAYDFRTTTFDGENWSTIFTTFSDEGMTVPLFTLEFEGPYQLIEKSTILPNTYNGNFVYSKKYITIFIEPLLLGLGDCGISIGEKIDIVDNECGFLGTLCDTDYDIIYIENDALTSGLRNPEMCTLEGRPTEIGFPMRISN